MMTLWNRIHAFAVSIFLSLGALAAQNPIGWSVSGVMPVSANIGQTYTVTYTFTNNLPFTLVNALVIGHHGSPAIEYSFSDNCTGLKLAAGQSCAVTVALNPIVVGQATVYLSIEGYSTDDVPLPKLSSVVGGQSINDVVASVTTPFPSQTQVGVTSPYAFKFTNNSAIVASNLSLTVTQTLGTSNHTTDCTGTLAANGGFCTVQGSYNVSSATPATQTVLARLAYTGPDDSPAQISTSTTAQAPSAPLVGSLVPPNYLPPLMTQGATYPIQMLFTASGSVTIPPAPSYTLTCQDDLLNDCSAQLSNIQSNCTPQVLNNAACQMTADFLAPAANNPPSTYTITGSVPYTTGGPTSNATVSTSGSVVTTLSATRTVYVTNNCSFDVWFSLHGGAVANSPTCPSQACPPQSTCDNSSNTCYWNTPTPANNTYLLHNTDSNSVTIPASGSSTQWSGTISASTGCSGGSCVQANCGNAGGTAPCAVGVGFSQPATQVEITMLTSTVDTYDVEVINGFHIPISIQPLYYRSGPTTIPAVPNNYLCGTAGNDIATNGFGSCDWATAAVPGAGYYWVTPGGTSCDITNPSCAVGTDICGLDANFNQVCGAFLGYWSADQVCGSANVPAAVQSYFQCNLPLPTATTPYYPSGAVLSQLMLCAVPKGQVGPRYNTCYNAYPGYSATDIAQCCGCADWWDPAQTQGQVIGSNPNTQSCTQSGQAQPQTNAQWNASVQTKIQWMKKACPSAYTYPFDDKTSTFQCTNNSTGQPNSTDYQVTFCPGNSGLPAGKTEGR